MCTQSIELLEVKVPMDFLVAGHLMRTVPLDLRSKVHEQCLQNSGAANQRTDAEKILNVVGTASIVGLTELAGSCAYTKTILTMERGLGSLCCWVSPSGRPRHQLFRALLSVIMQPCLGARVHAAFSTCVLQISFVLARTPGTR